ncbi:MAG: DUF6513 domain-containing protein [Planctomycetota bacterium]
MSREHFHFITGRLAAAALENTIRDINKNDSFDYTIQVLPITVAALMTPSWIAPRLEVPPNATCLVLPGYCDGDLKSIAEVCNLPIKVGPKDLRALPEFFGQKRVNEGYGRFDIRIIAEINHAPRLSLKQVLRMADALANDGADLIDVGCEPNSTWAEVGEYIRQLKNAGHRVSVDSLNPIEIKQAVDAGAELVLSVNQTNREFAVDWGCEVVVIPGDIRQIESMDETIDFLSARDVPLRIDPILEPIGFGFAESLHRYHEARRRWPEAEMMMGIGNLTELTDVDSCGINVLLLAICQELGVRSILTTQVINWSRTAVRECDLARRLVHYAITEQLPPKHLCDELVLLRDTKLLEYSDEELGELAAQIRDHNYRIFAQQGRVHLMGAGHHFSDEDPFEVFDALLDSNPKNVDPSHAFYLGFEMCKAMTAAQLGKQYNQDQALNWGYLTNEEKDRHRLKRRKNRD